MLQIGVYLGHTGDGAAILDGSLGKENVSMAERKNSEARIRTNNKWTNAHYDRINIAVPKGRKDEIKAIADTQGQSVNAYIISAVDEKMERDGAGGRSSGAG